MREDKYLAIMMKMKNDLKNLLIDIDTVLNEIKLKNSRSISATKRRFVTA